ncbi:MAG: peptidase domain-containing ABC transporter [Bacteroidales bacterium]|nr:peptidase domain-containing ABC transporter [Bacteroidales bacterium]MDY0216425.1 peptidase domain-containing ABC transporter [Bacteroidales bacterium]
MSFPFYRQPDHMDCGPTCLRMISKHFGKNYSLAYLREKAQATRQGVSLLAISDAAEHIGLKTMGVSISFQQLANEAPLPAIVHWKQNHFVVVYQISKKNVVKVADPAYGLLEFSKEEFEKAWVSNKSNNDNKGIALLFETTPQFFELKGEKSDRTKLSFLFKYLTPHRKYIVQLFLGMLLGSILQLIFPFLTQSVVDIGIGTQNVGFVTLILVAQLVLAGSQMTVDFLRNWILLHISTRININLISDFLIKLMKLPIGFFDSKLIGDIMQRIGDHSRIQDFLTGTSLTTLFSVVNLIVFSAVLAWYNILILGVFLLGNILYIIWILLFMKRRRELDFKRFAIAADNQSSLIQIITGMQEIKLNNCEKQKRWGWERLQILQFKISMKSLALGQYQQLGSLFLSQSTSIFVSFLAARAVIQGEMTLGMMMAVSYIIGQISSPINQMIGFIQSLQDAKISLERLGEIHNKDDEEPEDLNRITFLPENKSINIKDLSFRYDGMYEKVLDDINLEIPEGKITAIVGSSGSGKTTLIKLLLGFYKFEKGEIKIGDLSLDHINGSFWRGKCGVVMQDGFIFSESIAQNIAPGDENIDRAKLLHSVKIANIRDFVESLPLGYNTKIGQEGNGISQGQKQRILISRAVYKEPEFIFLDEATNALDAKNEKIIMQNLNEFFKGRTVVIVAHRLSTVKNADQIIVLEKGKIIEKGTHTELANLKGFYYELVKNQLELGN